MKKYAISLIVIFALLILAIAAVSLYFSVFRRESVDAHKLVKAKGHYSRSNPQSGFDDVFSTSGLFNISSISKMASNDGAVCGQDELDAGQACSAKKWHLSDDHWTYKIKVNFANPMKDKNYMVSVQGSNTGNATPLPSVVGSMVMNKTTTSFEIRLVIWQGYAQPAASTMWGIDFVVV